MGTGETRVAKKSGATGKNLFVRGLHVRMRADDRADLPIEHSRQGNFFRGGLGMEIDKNNVRRPTHPFDFGHDAMKLVLQGLHKSAALQVDDPDGRAALPLKDSAPLPWRSGRIIQGPNESRLIFE